MTYIFDEKKSTPLCEIMGGHRSDKGSKNIECSWHNYTTLYYSIFKDLREKQLRVFELGLGTNNINIPSNMGVNGIPGASLYGWADFFPNSRIYGADIDKDIRDEPELQENFDIIVEDGLHTFDANVCFFENSIHKLKPNGYYIIEDILCSQEYLFENKIKEWEVKHKDCLFTFVKIPSVCNGIDNAVLVVARTVV